MTRLAVLLAAALAWPAQAQDLTPGAVTATPWDDYRVAAALFERGERLRAGCLFYRAQYRARAHLTPNPGLPPSGAPVLFASLQEVVGRPINQWLGGDRDDWVAAMDCALDWAAANDDPYTPRAANRAAHAETLAGFRGFAASLPPAEELRAQRRAAGLPNR